MSITSSTEIQKQEEVVTRTCHAYEKKKNNAKFSILRMEAG